MYKIKDLPRSLTGGGIKLYATREGDRYSVNNLALRFNNMEELRKKVESDGTKLYYTTSESSIRNHYTHWSVVYINSSDHPSLVVWNDGSFYGVRWGDMDDLSHKLPNWDYRGYRKGNSWYLTDISNNVSGDMTKDFKEGALLQRISDDMVSGLHKVYESLSGDASDNYPKVIEDSVQTYRIFNRDQNLHYELCHVRCDESAWWKISIYNEEFSYYVKFKYWDPNIIDRAIKQFRDNLPAINK